MKTRNVLMKAIGVIGAIALSACSTMKVEPDRVATVKKVAIVGFDVNQQNPVSKGDLFKVLTKQKVGTEATVKGRAEAVHVEKMYAALRQKLEKENHWKILTQEQVVKNPAYQELFKAKTEGWQNRPIAGDDYSLMQAPGVLDTFALYTTPPEKLKALQEALGVDALLIVGVKVMLNLDSALGAMVGQGKFNPLAITSLQMKDGRTNDRIWFDSNAKGQPVQNDEKNFMGMADQDKLNQMAVLAAESSYDQLLVNYKEKATN
jgi:hypothetical protein